MFLSIMIMHVSVFLKVYSSDVDYSQYDSEILQLMHSQKLYPPRFVVNVSMPYNVKTGTTAIFQFKGADKVLRRELPLQLPTSGEIPVLTWVLRQILQEYIYI